MKPPSKPNLLNKQFVDFVLMMLNSDLSLEMLDQMMLASWLKLILIVIFKHDVDETLLLAIFDRILSVLQFASISEEVKQVGFLAC